MAKINQLTVPVEDATEDQLRGFAQNHLGIVFAQDKKREDMLAVVKSAWSKPKILVPQSAPTPEEDKKAEQAETAPASDKEPTIEVIIDKNTASNGPGKDAVFMSVNGQALFIPRGKPVTIKKRYYFALMYAEEIVYHYDPEKQEITPERAQRIPVRVLRDPSGVAAQFERDRHRTMTTASAPPIAA